MSHFTHIACLECGLEMPADALHVACDRCGSQWLDARYDYATIDWPTNVTGRAPTLWRYADLLPIDADQPRVTLGEGYTPLLRADGLQALLDHPTLYIKDERQQPTGSFKDRQGALVVSILKARGIRECVLASTGNAAAAYAAYCARAGIKLWVFLTSLTPSEKMRELALYGAEVVKVTGTYDEAKRIAADFAQRRGLYFDRGAKAVPGKESMKTIAFEIAEQLGFDLSDGKRWIAPDWYVQAVSGGIGPLGVLKGFHELLELKLIDKIPKIAILQVEGCSPMVQAFRANKPVATPVVPNTRITVLATGDPGFSYTQLYRAIKQTGGTMDAVDDGEAFRAMRRVARADGLSVEPATAVAFAGLEKLIVNGTIGKDELVLINCTGHTFPAEKHVLEDQYVLDLELGGAGKGGALDGLGAALEQLDEQVRTVVVIDDNPQDSRLIRRLLQSYKNYRVFEANTPQAGIDLVKQRKPGMVITDLTMPSMDGFTLIEQLKADPDTANIPVIVISAKTLTVADEQRLQSQQARYWQKGNFSTRDLVDHVVATLNNDTPPKQMTRPVVSGSIVPSGVPAAAVNQPPVMFQTPPPAIIAPRYTVLIIDDNPQDARLIRRILTAENVYRVIEAPDGESGLTQISDLRPDLILLDVLLPGMSGLDVLDRLRADESWRSIPVVILTGKDLTAAERERLGKVTLWSKSNLDRRQLLDSMQHVLD